MVNRRLSSVVYQIAWTVLAFLAVGFGLLGAGTCGELCGPAESASSVPAPSAQAAPHFPSEPSSPLEDFLQSEAVRADAQLNDVFFIDSQTGWAVGDRGTIWHTEDGGRSWRLQPSGTSARLLSVWFVNRQLGWVVGGQTQPYCATSRAVILTTQNEGRSWHPVANLLLPTLYRIRMVDPQVGFAVGESSPLGPTGVWFTGDGGRSWQPLLGLRSGGWLCGDFFNPSTGALAGRLGCVGMVRRGELAPSRTPPLGSRTVWRLELLRPLHGWLVGDGGLLMHTEDAGASWQISSNLPPLEVLRQFDLYALAVRGPKVWAAGCPGTRLFYSPDAGQSWHVFPTGQCLPIHGLWFSDDEHGWAVGALGTILATKDGGRNWTRQRCGGTRAALVCIVGQAERVPWEALAQWAGQEGYLTYVYIVGIPSPVRLQQDFPDSTQTLLPNRVHEATVLLGGAGAQAAWRFPLGPSCVNRQSRHIVARWNQHNDGRGLESLQTELVRLLRTWRPDVVLTHDADLQGIDPLGHLVNQLVLQAVELAEDPTAYVDQITQAGLKPWSVKRVFAMPASGQEGDFSLARASLVLRLGSTVAEAADRARGLLGQIPGSGPLALYPHSLEGALAGGGEELGFRLLRSRVPRETPAVKDLFERIILQPGGEARRLLPELAPEKLTYWQQQAKRRRHLEAIAHQGTKDPRLAHSLLAQTRQWVRRLEPNSAGQFLYNLGQMFIHQGQWPAAAEVLKLLVELQPEHPASGPALVWLVQYYASMEAAWRVLGPQRRLTAQWASPAWDPKMLEERWERAAALARLLEKHHPELFHRPELRFPLAVADRARGYPKQAKRWFFIQRRSLTHDAWWACAQMEDWLERGQGEPPKPIVFCTLADTKPHLDGRLDEAFWQQAKPGRLKGEGTLSPPASQSPAPASLPTEHSPGKTPSATTAGDKPSEAGQPAPEVRLAYDTQYLYIAVRCPKHSALEYLPRKGPRPRDPDLADHDRVEIFLDVDRDWTTYWHLVVDSSGWAGESCWGDWHWNPQWFVAAQQDAHSWTVEAAIRLDELTGFFPRSNSVWTIGLQRIIPGVGIQTFPPTGGRLLHPSEFGLLIFQ